MDLDDARLAWVGHLIEQCVVNNGGLAFIQLLVCGAHSFILQQRKRSGLQKREKQTMPAGFQMVAQSSTPPDEDSGRWKETLVEVTLLYPQGHQPHLRRREEMALSRCASAG